MRISGFLFYGKWPSWFFFNGWKQLLLYAHDIFFIHSFVVHLGWLHNVVVGNGAQQTLISCLEVCNSCKFLEMVCEIYFSFLSNSHTDFYSGWNSLHSHQQCMGSLSFVHIYCYLFSCWLPFCNKWTSLKQLLSLETAEAAGGWMSEESTAVYQQGWLLS